jgi:hypothetical protein
MVSFKEVTESNEALKERMNGLTCVFVGVTFSWGGEVALKALAAKAEKLTVFVVDKHEKAAEKVIDACKNLSPSSTFIFMKADVKLLKNVDQVCKEINLKAAKLNLLHMGQTTALAKLSPFRCGKLYRCSSTPDTRLPDQAPKKASTPC